MCFCRQSVNHKIFNGINGKPLLSFKNNKDDMRLNLNSDDQNGETGMYIIIISEIYIITKK